MQPVWRGERTKRGRFKEFRQFDIDAVWPAESNVGVRYDIETIAVMDKAMQDGIDPLIEAMHEWLCIQKKNNPKSFLLYNKLCDCDANGISYKRKTDILTNIYDEEMNSCGCNTKP